MRSIWIAVAMMIASCSLLLNPEDDQVRCVTRSGANDPCGEVSPGSVCSNGVCGACLSSETERCNGIDDDCNGRVDEGNDQDGDGFTWCGGGDQAFADCVDTDATIHPVLLGPDETPTNTDICGDGIDNDCSGVPDDSPNCESSGDCADDDTPCTSGSCVTCPSGQECVPCPVGNCGGRRTVCAVPLDIGSRCTNDSDCAEGICVDSAGLGLMSSNSKVCSKACCSDADCGENICVVRGNGTRLCAPPGVAGRITKRADEACDGDMECASNACDPAAGGGNALCRRLCSSDLDCVGAPHGNACIFRLATSGWVCGETIPDGIPLGGNCLPSPNRCDSQLCIASVVFIDGVCADTCGSQCDVSGYVCSYETAPLLGTMPLCVKPQGSAPLGQACTSSDECGEGRCIQDRCTNACCSDSDCPGARCRPVSIGMGTFGMYCLP